VTGETESATVVKQEKGRTSIRLDLARAGSCFVVFRKTGKIAPVQSTTSGKTISTQPLNTAWTLSFPEGWGAPASIQISELKAWKELDMTPEAKAFSGTATYSTILDAGKLIKDATYALDLGQVEMIAVVTLNGKKLPTLWTPPYRLDITKALKPGKNRQQVEETSSWFNRLDYNENQTEGQRKTWTISGPAKDAPLRDSGLLGPVVKDVKKE
jgi:hypothetical protein